MVTGGGAGFFSVGPTGVVGVVEGESIQFVCVYTRNIDTQLNWTLTDTNSNEVVISNDTTLPDGTVANVSMEATKGTIYNLNLSNVQRKWNGSSIMCSLVESGTLVSSTSATIEVYCKFPQKYYIYIFISI